MQNVRKPVCGWLKIPGAQNFRLKNIEDDVMLPAEMRQKSSSCQARDNHLHGKLIGCRPPQNCLKTMNLLGPLSHPRITSISLPLSIQVERPWFYQTS